jgi:N-acetylneuraminic acid mutarotase
VNGKVYVIGGNRGPGAPGLSIIEEYDPVTDSWTIKADMPTPRLWLSTCVVDGIIYAIGGAEQGGGANPSVSTVEAYDPETDTWATKADMPTARCYLSTEAVDGKIYAIGGSPNINGVGIAVVEMYDPETDKWTKKSDIPRAIVTTSTSAVNGIIYVLGGAPQAGALVSTVNAYNPATDTWTEKASMPTERGITSASVVDGKIYVIGGLTFNRVPMSAVEMYDPATDTWTEKPDMPETRFGLSGGAVNGKIYAIGGVFAWGEAGVSTVEEYNTGFMLSSIKPNGKLVRPWGEIKSD